MKKLQPCRVIWLLSLRVMGLLLSSSLLIPFSFTADADETTMVYPVSVQKIEVKDVHEWLHVYGRVGFDDVFVQNINVAYSGQVIRLPLLAGEAVKKGQILAEIAVDPAVAAAYQKALAGVNFAKSEVQRIKTMLNTHLATQSQWASAQKVLSNNQSQLHQLKEKGFGRSIHLVRATFDAVVVSVAVQVGQRIAAGISLMQLGHPKQLKIILGVEPEDMPYIQKGHRVLLYTNLNTIIHAKVNQVLHTVNPTTRLVDVLVRLHGEQRAQLLPGMTVAAELAARHFSQAFWVPDAALVQHEGINRLIQANKGKAHVIDVQVLLEQDGYAVVKGALNPQMLIVLQGVAELHDGDSIKVVAQP